LEFIIIQEPRPAVNSTKESKKGGRDSEGPRLNIHGVIDWKRPDLQDSHVANERPARLGEVEVGVEPEGMGLSPDGRYS
jgi:hypothetical protein